MVDYYELLRVSRSAGAEEIKRAYRQLAILLHPDKNPHPDAAEGFRSITEAYQVLADPEQKKKYDEQLELEQLIERKGPAYRDPAYRRTVKTNEPRPWVINPEKEFVRNSRPAATWTIRICFALCLLLFVDYLLPSEKIQEEVIMDEVLIQQTMRSVRQHTIETKSGHHFSVNYPDNLEFRKEPQIIAETSGLFNLLKSIRTKSGHFKIKALASLYGNFKFAPIILLFLTASGLLIQMGDELKFNIALVSLLLTLLNIFFFVISVW